MSKIKFSFGQLNIKYQAPNWLSFSTENIQIDALILWVAIFEMAIMSFWRGERQKSFQG